MLKQLFPLLILSAFMNLSPALAQTEASEAVASEASLNVLQQEIPKTETPSGPQSLEAKTEKETSKIARAEASLKEEDIPVFVSEKKKSEPKLEGQTQKAVMGLIIVLGAFLGMFLFLKKYWAKKGLESKHTAIRVVSEHHLGPRKTLSIVSVAGEFMLIGVTDHNINLIKSLSLLDEEVPQMDDTFEEHLEDTQQLGFVDEDLSAGSDQFSIRGLTDMVSKKLKNMKDLS